MCPAALFCWYLQTPLAWHQGPNPAPNTSLGHPSCRCIPQESLAGESHGMHIPLLCPYLLITFEKLTIFMAAQVQHPFAACTCPDHLSPILKWPVLRCPVPILVLLQEENALEKLNLSDESWASPLSARAAFRPSLSLAFVPRCNIVTRKENRIKALFLALGLYPDYP